jgi:polyhydroxyalkanoate synthesis regulator phasin
MNDLISKAVLSGLGLASLTKDELRKTAEDLADRSKLSEEEGRRLVTEFQRRSTHAQKTLEKKVHATVNQVLRELNLSTNGESPKRAKAAGKRPRKSRQRNGAEKPAVK